MRFLENFLIFKYINIVIHYLLNIKYIKCFYSVAKINFKYIHVSKQQTWKGTNKVCMLSGWWALQWVYLSIGSN